ncbi:response regulator transcription factor [Actinoplanes sp. RD1]|uniref:response regulator transcription factor n=1 Tax=Actinoplanes sp. RD1 TaxID=3064538 RepID=UPI0027413F4F|nr:response regulator transcription factor [Actinoplanes sp. RD1]
MTGELHVLVVDDHPVYRDGLRRLFGDFAVVGEAGDGEEALAYVAAHPVDVVLMDLRMPRLDGVGAIRRLREVAPAVRVVVLSTYGEEDDVVAAVASGAAGYLLKDAARTELIEGVRAAARGERVLSPPVADRLMRHLSDPPEHPLTDRERELLRLVAGGATNHEAASALFVSVATVKASLAGIYERLGARDRASAVAQGYRRGLLP